ncbi:GNAT family N-acetyltransferase [Terracidiphilus gabretensis]|uniref:GNAT family N-acetyltransferase n=1 Tax=Terracidiphilus gabretensis TaxID=1577687 RepID=UPI00071B2391|nr:GNAT family N-acetyltransferase [Terracidiphilus gabretensis]
MQKSTGADNSTKEPALVSASQEELAFNLDAIRIEPLSSEHRRGAFVCTNQTIQNYCRNNARKNNDAFMVRVFVACYGTSQDVIGYYYLSLTSYKLGAKDESALHLDNTSDAKFERVEAVPAVYLGMIGIHADYQSRGIGKLLMMDAIQRTAKIAQHAGLYALTLDALDRKVATYYKDKFGFQTFKEGDTGLEMFLPIKTIMDAVKE